MRLLEGDVARWELGRQARPPLSSAQCAEVDGVHRLADRSLHRIHATRMLTKHSFRLFSAGERQVLWLPARQRGECVRCFHASLQRPDKHELAGAGASRQETQQKKSPEANVVERVQARSGPPDSFSAASPHQPTKPATSQDRRRHQRSAMISEVSRCAHLPSPVWPLTMCRKSRWCSETTPHPPSPMSIPARARNSPRRPRKPQTRKLASWERMTR